jgi:hypothetical protein
LIDVDWRDVAYGCAGVAFLLIGMALVARDHFVWSLVPFALMIFVVRLRSERNHRKG